MRLTRYGIPAELAEARPESLLSPPAPCKAINALGCGQSPGWVNPGLGIDDLGLTIDDRREIRVPWHSWRFESVVSLSFDTGSRFIICGNRHNLRSISPLLFAWFAYFAVEQEFSVPGSQLSVAATGRAWGCSHILRRNVDFYATYRN